MAPMVLRALLLTISILCVEMRAAAVPAEANWLTKVMEEAGEASGRAAGSATRKGAGALDDTVRHLKMLPATGAGTTALAAHPMPGGHWSFANKAGEVFTAGNPEEMARVAGVLAPNAAESGRLSLYLSKDSVFAMREALNELPDNSDLYVVISEDSYPLVKSTTPEGQRLHADVRSNLAVELTDEAAFDEALFQLTRPLNKADVRVLALEPGGPDALTRLPRFDPETKGALIDAIDPQSLPRALGSLRGQTVVVTGKIEGDMLRYNAGADVGLRFRELADAAAAADVNLVVLKSPDPRQPGGRNWLWRKVMVPGLDAALKKATYADFLSSLGTGSGRLTVTASGDGGGRTLLTAVPTGEASAPIRGQLGDWFGGVTAKLTGDVILEGVDARMRDSDRQRELDLRLFPGIPAIVQISYLAALVLGLLGFSVARGWWRRLWPLEARADYAGVAGYVAARAARLIAFVVVFLPVAGLPAFLWTLCLQLSNVLLAPARALAWMRGRPADGRLWPERRV